jgi:hypothetical protein
MLIKINPEFGIELALAVPYAYWLHTQGKLKKIITSKGMSPFYYFCDNVEESFNFRTIDNEAAGLNSLPNNWIHGDTKAGTVMTKPAVLDYSKWLSPPYRDHYKNSIFNFDKPTVFISNIYNFEHGNPPKFHFFDVACLYELFTYLTEKGYFVIYKRPTNKEFVVDQNEAHAIQYNLDITANVEGLGIITDRDLPKYINDVILFDDLVFSHPQYTYNEVQLMIMANTDRFISVCGGNGILSSLFGGKTILYITQGRELRPNYFGPDSYWRKFSDTDVIPVFDVIEEINNIPDAVKYGHDINKTGSCDYNKLIKAVKDHF